jgi:hypothetical protein
MDRWAETPATGEAAPRKTAKALKSRRAEGVPSGVGSCRFVAIHHQVDTEAWSGSSGTGWIIGMSQAAARPDPWLTVS